MSLPFLSVKYDNSQRQFITLIKLTFTPFFVESCKLLLVATARAAPTSNCSRSFIFLSIIPQVFCGYCFFGSVSN